jgi:hypothetical protein
MLAGVVATAAPGQTVEERTTPERTQTIEVPTQTVTQPATTTTLPAQTVTATKTTTVQTSPGATINVTPTTTVADSSDDDGDGLPWWAWALIGAGVVALGFALSRAGGRGDDPPPPPPDPVP